MSAGPCLARTPLRSFTCPGPSCFEIAEESSGDRAREKKNLQRGRCQSEKRAPCPICCPRISINIGELDSQGREGTGTQMAGYLAVPPVPGQVLIAQVGDRAVTPRPSNARTFASQGLKLKESTCPVLGPGLP